MKTIRKTVKKEIAKDIDDCLSKSLAWMKSKYPNVSFYYVDYIFSNNFRRSRYFRNNSSLNDKYLFPCCCISTREQLYLYNKKSLGINKTSIWVGYKTQIECALIHELTHHVQYETKVRIGNELDTTANELQYLSEYYSEDYQEIIN